MLQLPAGISSAGRAELARATAGGKRTLTPSDLATALGIHPTIAAKKLAAWAENGWVRRARRGLYIPVPVDASHPTMWSEDPLILAEAVWSPCYFTGWTSAAHWNLTEQVFRTTVLKTTGRVRRVNEKLLDFDYLLKRITAGQMEWGLAPIWRNERRLQIADATRTIVDVLDDPRIGGGIRHVTEMLIVYLDDRDPHKLVDYAERLGNRTVFKRLGYLSEALGLGDRHLVEACHQRISAGVSLLDPSASPDGERVGRWHLRVNVRFEGMSAS